MRSISSALALALAASGALAQSYVITRVTTIGQYDQAWGLDGAGNVAGVTITEPHNRFLGFIGAGVINAPAGDSQAVVFGVTPDGRAIASSYSLGEFNEHALLFANGQTTTIGAFAPRGIAADGTIVGSRDVTYGPGWHARHACVLQSGMLLDLPTLGGQNAQAIAVSEVGRIVGFSYTATGLRPRAVTWSGGVITDLGVLGGTSAQALGIAGNYVVGVSDVTGGWHPFRYTLNAAGQVVTRSDLGSLGTGSTNYGLAYAVTESGDVVGMSADHAFLWHNGVMTDLNNVVVNGQDWDLRAASAINAAGQIAGWGTYHGNPAAFVLSAAPMCDPDLNQDGNVDQGDTDYLINVVAGGDNPTNIDPDFNHDGNVDQADIDALVNVVAGGTCP
ncbi:MAG: hypothetical protein WC718_02410 [Phycisphaerales bacterium]|jgi:probable HAF family extracellular repeat protein